MEAPPFAAPYSLPETVTFRVATDQDNLAHSVVEVLNYELFGGPDGRPVADGCFDARMGTTDHQYVCQTCGLNRRDDPGHLGRIVSRIPVPSPLFIPEIRRWLRAICLECGAPVVNLEKYGAEKRQRPRSQWLNDASLSTPEGVRCPACGAPHPKIVPADDDHFSFLAEYPAKEAGARPRTVRLSYQQIRAALERVTDASVVALGRPLATHPRALVLTVLPVPPNTIRPGIRMGFGCGPASYHDLTNMVQYLQKRNLVLPAEPPVALSRDLERQVLNYHQLYYDLIQGAAGTSPSQGAQGRRGLVMGARTVRSVTRVLSRKDGRLRKNLLGKRTWLISRSTISGNPSLRVDQVGFPVSFARTVSIRETVQEYNLDRLMGFFLNGCRQYPGCSRVTKRATGTVHRVDGLREFKLEVGDVIERDIVSGDLAFLNRQPSLEQSSIGVHEVIVLEDPSVRTFQINVVACSFYNADFDGDQMNLWVPAEVMTRVEAQHISAVANWFISSKTSGPICGEVQDSNIGCFLLTRPRVQVSKFVAMRLCAGTQAPPPDFSYLAPGETVPGRDIVSTVFAPTPINYGRTPTYYNENFAPFIPYAPEETFTRMTRGRLVGGVLDKKSVGEGARGGLFHLLGRQYGPRQALASLFSLQQVAIAFVGNCGFTVGTSDMVLPRASLLEVQALTASLLREAEEVTARLLRGELVPPIGWTPHRYYERLQIEALKLPDELLRPVLTGIRPETNGLFQMVATGSKGNTPNLFHIAALIGQVEINTERIPQTFAYQRTSPYFARFSVDPRAYGFIPDCYISGMSGDAYVFSDMNGRFDLINKALSTASTGYQNRKAVMALQSNLVDNYRRLAKDGRVVQMLYGEDGLDARSVEAVPLPSVFLDDAALRARYWLDLGPEAPAAAQAVFDAAYARVVEDRDWYRRAFLRLEDADFSFNVAGERQLPVHVERLRQDLLLAQGAAPRLPPEGLAAMQGVVDQLCASLPYSFLNEIQERRGSPVPAHLSAATGLLAMLLRLELGGPALVGLDPPRLGAIVADVRCRYQAALVDYGLAAGVLAAQAVSEPLTQYMLDSHHRSAGQGTNKAGIVRPAEIFGAKPPEAEQSPEMLLRVDPSIEGDRAAVAQVANQIELMTLERFVDRWAALLEPAEKVLGPLGAGALGPPAERAAAAVMYPRFAEDLAWLGEFFENHPLLPPPDDLLNWCARFELDKGTMVLKGMGLEALVERLRAKNPQAFVVHTPENAPAIVLRIYFRSALFRRTPLTAEKIEELIQGPLFGTVLRGVPNILRAEAVEVKRHRAAPDGSLPLRSVWAIRTTGTNIFGVALHPLIDPLRIVSSSIGDTTKSFGIAAGRAAIVREIRRAVGAKAPNARHLLLYADEMARNGKVTSLEKGGIVARERENVLLRMAMSFPVQHLTAAALENIQSRVHGIAAPMLLGQTPQLGTTYNSFGFDEEFVQANATTVNSYLEGLEALAAAP